MKAIWIPFLLIGHVICGPVGTGPRSGDANPRFMPKPSSGIWGNGVNSGSDSSSPFPSQYNPGPAEVPGSYSGRQDFYVTTTNMDELGGGDKDGSGPEKHYYGGYDSAYAPGGAAAGSQHYAASAYAVAAPADNYKGPEKNYYGGYDYAYAPGGAAAGSQHYAASAYAVAPPADNYKGPEKHYYGGYDSAYAPGGAAAGSQHYAASAYAVAAPADNYKDSDSKYAQGETVETQDGDPISEAEALAIYYTNLSDKEALNREPVFSDVSDLEPVYTFSSRSKYNRGRSVFSQTRYTPGEPAPIFPMSQSKNRRPSKAGY